MKGAGIHEKVSPVSLHKWVEERHGSLTKSSITVITYFNKNISLTAALNYVNVFIKNIKVDLIIQKMLSAHVSLVVLIQKLSS